MVEGAMAGWTPGFAGDSSDFHAGAERAQAAERIRGMMDLMARMGRMGADSDSSGMSLVAAR
jgi:hypothetical protein